jgi:hypothetical protein
MLKKIDFFIPFYSPGLKTLEYLINNLLLVTTKFKRLNIIVSYHNKEELKYLESSSIFKYIYKTVHAPIPLTKIQKLFFASYCHSIALKYLIKNIESEIVIISDQDIAILKYGWDEIIEHNLNNNYDLIATSYPEVHYKIPYIGINKNQQLITVPKDIGLQKYSKLPNLYFFCTKNTILKKFFNNKLTNFDEYLLNGNLPIRIINTKKLESENNLELGSYQWLDTGYEIPEIIYNNKLSYLTFIADLNQKTIPFNKEKNLIFEPEIFLYPGSNYPFLIHFKKSSAKLGKDQFYLDVEFKLVDEFLKKNK